MKCPNKVRLCVCNENCCPCFCHCMQDPNREKVKSHDMFDILAHHVSSNESKGKAVPSNKMATTYRYDYCRKKRIPSPTKIRTSYPGLLIPNQKMYCGTTHKQDFKRYFEKEVRESRGKIVSHKDTLTCSKAKFEGKSETKSTFRLVPKKTYDAETTIPAPFKNSKNKNRTKTFNSELAKTTYSSSYKKPREYPKLKRHPPKLDLHKKLEPFKGVSQYQDDYRKPLKQKRENFPKTTVYCTPDIPMEDKTTYKSAFYYKAPIEKEATKWHPNHRIYKTSSQRCKLLTDESCGCIKRNQINADISKCFRGGDNNFLQKETGRLSRDCEYCTIMNVRFEKRKDKSWSRCDSKCG